RRGDAHPRTSEPERVDGPSPAAVDGDLQNGPDVQGSEHPADRLDAERADRLGRRHAAPGDGRAVRRRGLPMTTTGEHRRGAVLLAVLGFFPTRAPRTRTAGVASLARQLARR